MQTPQAPPVPDPRLDPFTAGGTPPSESDSSVTGDPPQVTTKPGYQKSEGQLTILFTLASVVLSFVGFKYSPDKVQNAYEAIQTLIYIFGPLVASIPILKNYINSRGKITSNSVWANAQLLNPMVSKDGVSPTVAMGLMGGGGSIGSILSGIGGGSGMKDPQTWTGIAKIIGGIAGGKTGKIIGQVTGGMGGSGSSGGPSSAEIEEAFKVVVNTLNTHADVIVAWWNSEHTQQQASTLADVMKFAQDDLATSRSSTR